MISATSMAERATSDMLIGPDWAMNTEICELLNRDPAQAKDVVKVLKRRVRSRRPKVQLLALTLLDTMVKHCSDIVHMHIAEKNILHKMVKVAKKKPDPRVKEKILVLIDTWQEALGGPRARYLEFFEAYQELLQAGVIFPRRREPPAPKANSTSNEQCREDNASSPVLDFPLLSLVDIQNARGTMNVLSEMLDALDPVNKEELKQEVIVDLVEQCRVNKRKVFHLINTTPDEELLSQGLALNDDLQHVLAKHDALAAGIPIQVEKPKPLPALVDIGEEDQTQAATMQSNGSLNVDAPSPSPFHQLLLDAPPMSSEPSSFMAPPVKPDPMMDLLSWDDVTPTPVTESSLALIPVNGSAAVNSDTDQKSLVLHDVFSQNHEPDGTEPARDAGFYTSQDAAPIYPASSELQNQFPALSNGRFSGSGMTQHEQANLVNGIPSNEANLTWNYQAIQTLNLPENQQLALNSGSEDQGGEALPPPPWEIQATEEDEDPQSHPFNHQTGGLYPHGVQNSQPEGTCLHFMQGPQIPHPQSSHVQPGQSTGIKPNPMQAMHMADVVSQQPIAGTQMGSLHFQMQGLSLQNPMQGGQIAGSYYAYAQHPESHHYDQMRSAYHYANTDNGIYTLPMQDSNGQMNAKQSYRLPASSSMPSLHPHAMKVPKPEDKLFGDLVSMAKSKSTASFGKVGST